MHEHIKLSTCKMNAEEIVNVGTWMCRIKLLTLVSLYAIYKM